MSRLLRKAPFPPQAREKPTSRASISPTGENPPIPLGTPGSRHMVPSGFGDRWGDTQVSAAETWAPKVGPIVPEHSRPCSMVCSNIS